MSQSNGIISAPVDMADPYYVMGVGQYNGWWDEVYMCANVHGRTNPFSKYKPVRLDSFLGRDDTGYFRTDNYQQMINYSTDWFRGKDGHCGFIVPATTVLANPSQPDPVWQYAPPAVGEWSRLIDFIGYNHNASPELFRVFFPTQAYLNSGFTVRVSVDLPNDSTLALADVFSEELAPSRPSNIAMMLSLRSTSNGSGLYVEKEISIHTNAMQSINFSAQEMQLGGMVGSKLWGHIYIRSANWTLLSARNSANTQTIFEATYVSSEKYRINMICQAVLNHSISNKYSLDVRNLTPRIITQGYTGGTFPASNLRMYKATDGEGSQTLWEVNLPAVTVPAGTIYTFSQIPDQFYVTYFSDIHPEDKVLFVWRSNAGDREELTQYIIINND